jgi:hypothetical protein
MHRRPAHRYIPKLIRPPSVEELSLDLEAAQSRPVAEKILAKLILSGKGRIAIEEDLRRRRDRCDQFVTDILPPCLDSTPGGDADIKLQEFELKKLSENSKDEVPFLVEIDRSHKTSAPVRSEAAMLLQRIAGDPKMRRYVITYLNSTS